MRGQLLLELRTVYFTADTEHEALERVVGVGPTTVVHDQSIEMGELRLSAELALSARFGLAVTVPLKRFSTDITYRDALFGNEVEIEFPDLHHRDETLTGIGDPWLEAVWRWGFGRVSVSARAGVSLPLGKTEEDPFTLGDMGLEHEHFQFGSGTVDPLFALSVGFPVWRLRYGAWLYTRQTLYEGEKGYQAGDRYAGGLFATLPIGGRVRLRAGGDVMKETSERWNGVVHSEEGNIGRTDVLLHVGVSVLVGAGVELAFLLRDPIYQDVQGGQIDMPAIFEVGLAWRGDLFGGAPPAAHRHEHEHGEHEHGEHEHGEHEHGEHEVDDAGLDVADLTTTGEAVELGGVPGKITIYDFWAPWCAPCKELTPELVELVRRHPDRVALRKINVVDWDSPAAAKYLTPGGFSLPHVKVVGPDGQLLYERSASPPTLVGDVEEIITRP